MVAWAHVEVAESSETGLPLKAHAAGAVPKQAAMGATPAA